MYVQNKVTSSMILIDLCEKQSNFEYDTHRFVWKKKVTTTNVFTFILHCSYHKHYGVTIELNNYIQFLDKHAKYTHVYI